MYYSPISLLIKSDSENALFVSSLFSTLALVGKMLIKERARVDGKVFTTEPFNCNKEHQRFIHSRNGAGERSLSNCHEISGLKILRQSVVEIKFTSVLCDQNNWNLKQNFMAKCSKTKFVLVYRKRLMYVVSFFFLKSFSMECFSYQMW